MGQIRDLHVESMAPIGQCVKTQERSHANLLDTPSQLCFHFCGVKHSPYFYFFEYILSVLVISSFQLICICLQIYVTVGSFMFLSTESITEFQLHMILCSKQGFLFTTSLVPW